MLNVVTYARVSTTRQAEEGESLPAQVARMRAWAQHAGYAVAGEYADAGLSGATCDRPGLRDALACACTHRATLVVANLSRLGRCTREVIEVTERLQDAGAGFVSISEALDSRNMVGRLLIAVLAAVAQWEREAALDRQAVTINYLMREGRRLSAIPPFGYDIAADGEHLAPNPAEQQIIARIRAERVRGLSMQRIADGLNADGVTSKQGRDWRVRSVEAVLRRAARLAAA